MPSDNRNEARTAIPSIPERGSFNKEAHRFLVAQQAFADALDLDVHTLMGGRFPRSQLRNETLRMVVVEFGYNRVWNLAYYQKACAHLGNAGTIRNEMYLLSTVGLLVSRPDPGDKRGNLIYPAQHVINWYEEQISKFHSELRRFVEESGLETEKSVDLSN